MIVGVGGAARQQRVDLAGAGEATLGDGLGEQRAQRVRVGLALAELERGEVDLRDGDLAGAGAGEPLGRAAKTRGGVGEPAVVREGLASVVQRPADPAGFVELNVQRLRRREAGDRVGEAAAGERDRRTRRPAARGADT